MNRLKNAIPSVHPLGGTQLRALCKLEREEPDGRFPFVSERGAPITAEGFRKMVRRAAERARFAFKVHPHMIRHACGYKLATEGRDAGGAPWSVISPSVCGNAGGCNIAAKNGDESGQPLG